MRDPKRPAVVRAAHHVVGPAAFPAAFPADCPVDFPEGGQLNKQEGSLESTREGSRFGTRADKRAAVREGQSADHIGDQVEGPFEDQARRWSVPRLDCRGRGGPRCSMDMRVVVAMSAEVRMAVGNLRGRGRRPTWVLESR